MVWIKLKFRYLCS